MMRSLAQETLVARTLAALADTGVRAARMPCTSTASRTLRVMAQAVSSVVDSGTAPLASVTFWRESNRFSNLSESRVSLNSGAR